MLFRGVDWGGISPANLRGQETLGFPNRYLDWGIAADASKARSPNPQENFIARKHAAIAIDRPSGDPYQGLSFSGNPFGTTYLRTKVAQSREILKKPSHPAGRGVLGGCITAQHYAVRVEVIQPPMRAPESHKFAALLDQPRGVNIIVVQADKNGCRVEGDVRVAPDNSLQCQRIAMAYGFSHPGISRRKAVRVELVLFGERFERREMAERVAALG